MDTLKINKVLACMEDLTCGIGTMQQKRAGQTVEVNKIDQHFAVTSEDDIRKVDTTQYTYVKLGENAYRFDQSATSGIPSDFGPGFWVVSYLDAAHVKAGDKSLSAELADLSKDLADVSGRLGAATSLFSAKLTKGALGWVLTEADKVNSANTVRPAGYKNSVLELVFEGKPRTLFCDTPGFYTDFKLNNDSAQLAFLTDLTGRIDAKDAGLSLDKDLFQSIVSATKASNGSLTVVYPDSSESIKGKTNPFRLSATALVNSGEATSVKLVKVAEQTTLKPLAPLSAYVKYSPGTDDFSVLSSCTEISATKGASGSVVVSHPDIAYVANSVAESAEYISKASSAAAGSNVSLYGFDGNRKTTYDDKSNFYLSSASLVSISAAESAEISFDLGTIVVPDEAIPVGFSFLIYGLLEV